MADDFDPDKYLGSHGGSDAFDPDAYLAQKPPPKPAAKPMAVPGYKDAGAGLSGATGALDTLPFGHTLEAGAGALNDYLFHDKTGKSFGQLFDQNQKVQDEVTAVSQDAHPEAKWAGRAAGVAAQVAAPFAAARVPAVAAARLAAPVVGRGLVGAVLKSVPTNAIMGGASGFDNSRGDMGQRLDGAKDAAALSVALGVPLSVAGYLLSKGVGFAAKKFASGAEKNEAEALSTGKQAAEADMAAKNDKVFAERRALLSGEGAPVEGEAAPAEPSAFEERTVSRRAKAAGKESADLRRTSNALALDNAGQMDLSPEERLNALEKMGPGQAARGMGDKDAIRKALSYGKEPTTSAMSTDELRSAVAAGGDRLSGPDVARPPMWTEPRPIPESHKTFASSEDATAATPGRSVRSKLPHPDVDNPEPYMFQGEVPSEPGSLPEKIAAISKKADAFDLNKLDNAGYVPRSSPYDILKGGVSGGMSAAGKGALPAMGLGFEFGHHAGLGSEGLGIAAGVGKGMYEAASPIQRAEKLRMAQQLLQSPNTRAMGYALMRSLQSGEQQVSGHEEAQLNPKDNRRP